MAGERDTAPRDAGILAWQSLDTQTQFALVRRVVRRRGAALRALHDGILSVGPGFKVSRGEVTPRVCLTFLVRRKLARPVTGSVPRHVSAYAMRGAQRVLVRIPTDVEERGAGSPHGGAVNVAHGIRARSQDARFGGATASVRGAACCVAAAAEDATVRFLLGCSHVLALSKGSADCAGVDSATIADLATSTDLAFLHDYSPLSPSARRCVDAAIAIVDFDFEALWDYDGKVQPTRVAEIDEHPADCVIYTPRAPIAATFITQQADVALRYSCGEIVIECVSIFEPASTTRVGDSGSPLIGAGGTLYGMHIWGNSSGTRAYAIPAALLFRPGLFRGVTLQLV